MDKLVDKHNLHGIFPYLDNLTIGGIDQADHDRNLNRFYETLDKYQLTLNHDKSIISVTEVNMLGFRISHGLIKPDPDRMQPLLNLPYPHDAKALKRAVGLFSYYSKWVPQYSEKVKSLISTTDFPLSSEARHAFDSIKGCIVNAELATPNDFDELVVETDASDSTISASLNQNGRPVAFFTRTLHSHERNHPSIEKEAAAIVEACRKWRHYLHRKKFLLITDQKSVSFIFDSKNRGKIKNDKLLRWKIELSCMDFNIKYRPGPENHIADCLTRAHCASIASNQRLIELHEGLCHPGVSRLSHYVRTKNLPYSMEDIKTITSQCRVCAEVKPRFYRPNNPPLIKSTKPFERLSIDFKGPLPSSSPNKYMLTIIDEYSRFPFVYPCKDMTAPTILRCLGDLFAIFGLASYIHSDNGPSLICKELRQSLLKLGIAYSNSAIYNPKGNGQVERYNGIVWQSIQLALKTKNIQTSQWEEVIPAVLHSVRSLVCTSTNETPHERLFSYQRRSVTGHSLPTWLLEKGTVLLRKHIRKSKYDPLCEEVELVRVTPTYAQVRYQSGREQTVSLRDLAPLPDGNTRNVDQPSRDDAVLNMENTENNTLSSDHGDEPPILVPQESRPVMDTRPVIDTPPATGTRPAIDTTQFTRNVFTQDATDVFNRPNSPISDSKVFKPPNADIRWSTRNISKPELLNYSELGGSNK